MTIYVNLNGFLTESSGMAGTVLVERKSDLVQDILAAASKRVSDAHLGAKSSVLCSETSTSATQPSAGIF